MTLPGLHLKKRHTFSAKWNGTVSFKTPRAGFQVPGVRISFRRARLRGGMQVKATIVFLESDCVYAACTRMVPDLRGVEAEGAKPEAERRCQKRMREDSEGQWYCEACCERSTPDWRFRLSLGIEDHTAKLSCIGFDVSCAHIAKHT